MTAATELASVAHARHVARLIAGEGGYTVSRRAVRAQLPTGEYRGTAQRGANNVTVRLKKSLALLEKLGLIYRHEDQIYIPDLGNLELFADGDL